MSTPSDITSHPVEAVTVQLSYLIVDTTKLYGAVTEYVVGAFASYERARQVYDALDNPNLRIDTIRFE
jgi:hypothetical protein